MKNKKTTKLPLFFITTLIFSLVFSHPDPRVLSKDKKQCTPDSESNLGENGEFIYPYPVSWHVHVTFNNHNKEELEKAVKLREKARNHFKDYWRRL